MQPVKGIDDREHDSKTVSPEAPLASSYRSRDWLMCVGKLCETRTTNGARNDMVFPRIVGHR